MGKTKDGRSHRAESLVVLSHHHNDDFKVGVKS